MYFPQYNTEQSEHKKLKIKKQGEKYPEDRQWLSYQQKSG